MKHRSRYYYIQQSNGAGEPVTLGHSENKETGEVYYRFADKKRAQKLMNDERALEPDKGYRMVKVTETLEVGAWQ